MDKDHLYEIAKERYYRVFPFEKGTKKIDTQYIRVGIINIPSDPIRWNFYDGKRLLSDMNFDKADNFCDGCAIVTRDHKMNVLKLDGTLMFDEWYHYITRVPDMDKHFIVEKAEDEYGLKSKSAVFMCSEKITDWYERVSPVTGSDGIVIVSKNVGPRWVDNEDALYDLKSGKIISDWYTSILSLMEIFKDVRVMRVRKGELHNLLRPDGQPVFDVWSTKQVVPDGTGNCQLFDSDGNVHNLSLK